MCDWVRCRCWLGLDLHSGKVIETVSNPHNSGDFIAFLKKVGQSLPGAPPNSTGVG
jgi:hypothetical protein